MKATPDLEPLSEAIARARAHSPFLRQQLDRGGPVAEALEAGDLKAAIAAARGEGEGMGVAATLRRERSGQALALGLGDLAGLLPLEEIVRDLSDLADRSLARALAAAIAERIPDARPRGFAIVALGKLGGRELNDSSDIDLLYLYDPATLPRKSEREAPDQAALRV
ncbi:MAG: glutamine-synthetase adenylyltransferase, partial [Sphingosinicella sp.]